MQAPLLTYTIGRLWGCLLRKMKHCVMIHASVSLQRRLSTVGQNTQISPDLLVDFAENVVIGDWVYIGPGGKFFGRGGLTIADHVIIGPEVTIMTSMHNYKNARFVPYDEVELLNPVYIGRASWIGLGAILMPGVSLGNGCIVGAGSIVTKSFPDGSIIGGNPAKVISTRDMDHFSTCLAEGRVYLKNKVSERLEKVELAKASRNEYPANQ